MSELSGIGRILPNPHLLIEPYIRREAVLSSRIEGTRTNLSELLSDEAGQPVDEAPDDLGEVRNYVTALDAGIQRLASLPLSLRLVRELHGHLMRGVRGEHATPGEFRRSQNWIGPPGSTPQNAPYVPPPLDEMQHALAAWGAVPAQPRRTARSGAVRLDARALRSHPPVSGRQRPGRAPAHPAVPDRAWQAAAAAAVPVGIHRAPPRWLLPRPDALFANPHLDVQRVKRLLDVSDPAARKLLQQLEERGIVREPPACNAAAAIWPMRCWPPSTIRARSRCESRSRTLCPHAGRDFGGGGPGSSRAGRVATCTSKKLRKLITPAAIS